MRLFLSILRPMPFFLAEDCTTHSLHMSLSSPLTRVQSTAKPEEPCGTIQTKDERKNVRVLFINGIRNSRADCVTAAQKVHDIFHARTDFIHTSLGLSDAYFCTKTIAHEGQKTAGRLHEICREIQANERLILVAHSAGCLVLQKASQMLSDEEKKKITVLTFGATYAFPADSGFAKVVNVVARGDIFSRLSRLRRTGASIISVKGGLSPISEHYFLGETYQKALRSLSQDCA